MYIYTHTLPTKPTKHDTQTCLITLSRWSRQSMCSRCLTNFFITLGWGNGWGNGWVLLWISLSLSLQFFLFLWLWLAPNLCNILGASPAWSNQCWFGAGWSIHGETDVDAVRRERFARFPHWVYPSSFDRGRPTFPRCPNGPNPPYRIFGHSQVRAALYAGDWCHGILGTENSQFEPRSQYLVCPNFLQCYPFAFGNLRLAICSLSLESA